MSWSKVNEQRCERLLGENETFIKIVGDAARPFNREHWAINIIVSVTPLGSLAKENQSSVFREAWRALRFRHPTIAAYIVDETKYVYDIPDLTALEKWTAETFQVIEDKTVDEVIASATRVPYATMTFFPQTGELLGRSQHWRTDGIGGLILMDDFLDLAAQSAADTSSLPWGEETDRLASCVEEASSSFITSEKQDRQLGQQCVASFGHAAGAIGIASRAPAETSPGGTRISRLHLTEQETRAVVQGCKARGLSVTAAVHASIAGANYALATAEDQNKHYTSTIRYSLRPFLPGPYSGRQYASTILTTGWMFPVSSESSWSDRARAYHGEYRKGLSHAYISAHREYAIGLCNLLRSLPKDIPSPTDVDISSLGVCERFVTREKGTAERGIRIDRVSGGLDMINRQCVCHVWTFRDQLCLNLVYNEAFYDRAEGDSFLQTVKNSLLHELIL
ncbi:hypothetical protein DTO027I6_3054 [Penicillium roqueforti]|uniref:uncharacterized protein n=1 Tax=Penicillium roqueforti TaxID=5082 RepID=UPI00190D5779|nr:uncharacterized protein LCP9604111_138 [Penicillium roqueforti]KAF9252612.1 hypothetical protein LCP9604111_138 [Penicillium roqueforti]KAI1835673.1 hypothetical protein CBS147337_3696 [Penicillium roqueforti]KAI2675476.1 hypothetical protein CBS147355_6470 [Penicillium roqueforti]KAI2687091.1 hypothetical protein LCP963914a_3692 [Penicillium roqueforti]KAI2698435.1 hypothetical protein CBS147372_6965 [Penicillium roqueforti]